MMELLRSIRDKISMETMDMSFEELEKYFKKRNAALKRKYKTGKFSPLASEPAENYINKEKNKRKKS